MPQCTEINRGLAIRLVANEMQNAKFKCFPMLFMFPVHIQS